MKKKAVFIINLKSGTSDKAAIPDLIDTTLDKELFDYEIAVTEYAGHASEIAAKAKDNGIDVVVAVGGDGTVNEVAKAIVHSNTALGIIPCGSGNGLARHLLLPINARKAIEVINRCEIRDLDYGIINGYPFFCTCGMGFDAFVSMKFAEAGKRGPKNMLDDLPDSFNEAQLEALRISLGKTKEGTNTQLRQWVFRGFISYSAQTGLYTKRKE